MKKTCVGLIFVYLEHTVAFLTGRSDSFLDRPCRRELPLFSILTQNRCFRDGTEGENGAAALCPRSTYIPIYVTNVGQT